MDWIVAGVVLASFAYSLYLQSKLRGRPDTHLTIQGPTASEGVPIMVVFGTKQITNPNVCWFGNQRDYESDGTHYYSLALQLVLCHGPIDALVDIVTNGKRTMWRTGVSPSEQTDPVTVDGVWVYAGQIGVSNDRLKPGFGGILHLGAVNNSGTDAGEADAMAMAMGMEVGPKYYGVAWINAIAALGTSPTLSPAECIVQRIHTQLGGAAQWYDAKAEIKTGRSLADLWKYKLQAASDTNDWSGVAYDDSEWEEAAGPISNAPATAELMDYDDYPLPLVKTQLPEDGTLILDGGTFYYGNKFSGGKVQQGCKLWLRWNLGALPAINIFAQLWHDDSAKLWFNGTQITLKPTVVDTIPNNEHFNSTAAIDASLINPTGPNVVAMRVLDSYVSVLGSFGPGPKIGSNKLIFAGLQLGNDTSVPGKLVDMNPAHIVYEVLTNTLWGLGYNAVDLDLDSFTAAADTLYGESFGMSLAWSQQSTIEDFITEILRHISGVLYVDRTTGLFVLKLIRADYDVDDLLTLDETNLVKIEDAKRKLVGELVNSVTVTYSATPRGDQGSLTIFDEGLLQQQGGVVSSKIDYPGVTNSFIAGNLALRDLRALSSPLLSCVVYANREAAELNIGDAFVLTWPDFSVDAVVMRVASIDVGDAVDNTVKIECVEDVFYYPNQKVTGTNAPIAKLPPASVSSAVQDIYHTCLIIDPRDKGLCECAFNASEWSQGLFSGWTEISPGVMERTVTGPLTDAMVDGVNVDDDNPLGVSSLLGKRVFALPDTGDISYKQYAGPYIVDDVGGHFIDYGLPSQAYVYTHARMHRDPDFSASAQFTAEATFQMRNGTVYGGHFLQLSTVDVVLGTTKLEFTDEGTSITWTTARALLKSSEVAGQHVSLDVLDISTTTTTQADFDGFQTLVGTPGARVIPAGPWQFNTESVWLDPTAPGDPGSITTLGYKVWRDRGSVGEVLFEVLSAQITAEAIAPLAPIVVQQPQFLLDTTDRLVLIPTIRTDSATPVKLWLRYNSPSLSTGVQIPVTIGGTVVVETPTPIVVPASAMQLDGPSRYTILGSAGNHTTAIGLPHGSTMGASVLVQIPKVAQSGTMRVRPIWAPSASAESGSVRWNIRVAGMTYALTGVGVDTPFTGQAAPFTVDVPVSEDGVVVAAPLAGSWLRIGVQRLGLDAEDTYTGQANLLGVQIDY